jgi:hypothetical protein
MTIPVSSRPQPKPNHTSKLIHYDRYTELLGKRIHCTITPALAADVAHFETAQRKRRETKC